MCEGANTLIYLIGNISCKTSSADVGELLGDLYIATNVIAILQGLGIAMLRLSHPKIIAKILRRKL